MSHLICCSMEPFQLLYSKHDTIQEIYFHNDIRNSYKCKDEIKCIVLKSFHNFFVITMNSILEYKLNGSLQLLNTIKIKNKYLRSGVYNLQNEMLYCVDDHSLYLVDKKGISCSFPNIKKYLIDKYRFFSFDTKHFLSILQCNNYCILSTKKKIEKMLQLIWKHTNSFKIQFQCIFKYYYIFLIEQNKKKNIVSIDSRSFLLEIIDIERFVGNYLFHIVSDTFLYLIVCVPNVHTIYLHYYSIETNNIYNLFDHSFYFPHSEEIEKCNFYFFEGKHYAHLFTKEEQKVLYIFHLQEKLKLSLQFEKNEKNYIKCQYQHYQSILYKKNNRIENDVMTKTLGKCCICYENNICVLFLPCSHICSCSSCGFLENINSCPICREIIFLKKTVYILTK